MNTLFSNQNTVTTYEVSVQPLRLLTDVVAECVAAGVSRPVDPAHAARVLWAATSAVDAIIRRDDQLKEEVVGPMMGDEWPSRRVFPNRTVDDGDDVRLGGLTLSVRELGPGESHVDSLWQLDARTIVAGDVAYNGMHAYLADGHCGTGSPPSIVSRPTSPMTSPCSWGTVRPEARTSWPPNVATSRRS